MTITEIFSHANMAVFNHLGIPAVYTPTPGGASRNLQALVSSSLQSQPSGMGSETWGQHITVEMLLSDFNGHPPSAGDTIDTGTVIYTLAAQIENNGIFVKWVVES